MTERLILALAVVLIDTTLFVVPLAGVFVAYVIVARPPWFQGWVAALYARP